jgi:hypothetical protein
MHFGERLLITKKPNESIGERWASACFQRLWDASEPIIIISIQKKFMRKLYFARGATAGWSIPELDEGPTV